MLRYPPVAGPPCPDFETPLERFADGECESDESLRVRDHLSGCSGCRIALRSHTELSRRIAQSPAPPVPPELEDRIRRALQSADVPRRRRAWIPAAAAAVLLVSLALFLRPTPARAEIPAFVVATSAVHDAFLSGAARIDAQDSPDKLREYFERLLKAEVVAPAIDEGACVGGCPCSIQENKAPWILYRRGGTPISLILVDDAPAALPEDSKRSLAGRAYHAFRVGGNTIVVCRTGGGAHVWISRLPEEELVACALETREGHGAFAGDKLSIRGVVCRACCAQAESRAKKVEGVSDAKVNLASMELIVAGKKRLDLDRLIRELREAGLDVHSK